MQIEQSQKQQVIDRIKKAVNILVTVNRNPSVDELSSALALSMMLNKLDKSAVAVFGGEIPRAIDFLEPNKTFEDNIDGLRDFIIALDKEKADRLRYKVEDDMVRVYITPYKTTITEKDLKFSQGDFNVDLIIALGVILGDDLDSAISSHGKVLHDAQIITINQRADHPSIGEIDWSDDSVSGLCEMIMGISESLGSELIDQPIASALLTGFVSSTDRFRNERTTPKVMTMAAQLMAAGANQQLIAENLEMAEQPQSFKIEQQEVAPAHAEFVEGSSFKIDQLAQPTTPEQTDAPEALTQDNGGPLSLPPLESQVETLPMTAMPPQNNVLQDLKEQTDDLNSNNSGVTDDQPIVGPAKSQGGWRDIQTPTVGGTLNATTQAAEDAARAEAERHRNQVILSHDGERKAETPMLDTPPLNGAFVPSDEPPSVDPFAAHPAAPAVPSVEPSSTFVSSSTPGLAFEMPPLQNQPSAPAVVPEPSLPPLTLDAPEPDLPPLPPSPTATPFDPFAAPSSASYQSQLPVPPQPQMDPEPVAPSAVEDARAAVSSLFGDTYTPLPAQPAQPLQPTTIVTPPTPQVPVLPMPDFSTLPPLPGEVIEPVSAPVPQMPNLGFPEQAVQPPVVNSTDPAQFKLPGQA